MKSEDLYIKKIISRTIRQKRKQLRIISVHFGYNYFKIYLTDHYYSLKNLKLCEEEVFEEEGVKPVDTTQVATQLSLWQEEG